MTGALNVVLDTNVLVSALWSENGNPAKIARMIPDKKIIPHFCEAILLEYRTVLLRPAFHFSPAQVDDLLGKIIKHGKNIDAVKSDIPMPDESDRVFYDIAEAAGAYLITGNKKHYPSDPAILTPVEFLSL